LEVELRYACGTVRRNSQPTGPREADRTGFGFRFGCRRAGILISAKLVEAHILVPTGTGDFFAFVIVCRGGCGWLVLGPKLWPRSGVRGDVSRQDCSTGPSWPAGSAAAIWASYWACDCKSRAAKCEQSRAPPFKLDDANARNGRACNCQRFARKLAEFGRSKIT
jgi:hypothetical protein